MAPISPRPPLIIRTVDLSVALSGNNTKKPVVRRNLFIDKKPYVKSEEIKPREKTQKIATQSRKEEKSRSHRREPGLSLTRVE